MANLPNRPEHLWWGWWFSHKVVSNSWDLMDYSPPGSSVQRISQARILVGLLFPSPRNLPNPGIEPRSHIYCRWSPALQVDSYQLSHQGASVVSFVKWGSCQLHRLKADTPQMCALITMWNFHASRDPRGPLSLSLLDDRPRTLPKTCISRLGAGECMACSSTGLLSPKTNLKVKESTRLYTSWLLVFCNRCLWGVGPILLFCSEKLH